MKRLKWILACVVLLLLASCVIGSAPVEFVFFILAGWSVYIATTLPQVTVNWADVAVGLAALLGFSFGVHWFCAWLAHARVNAAEYSAPQKLAAVWRWHWSASIVALVVLMFVAGTAMIGLIHQTSWLLTMKERKVDYGNMEAARRNGSLNNARSLAIAAQNRESATHKLPPGCTTDAQGRLLHGWLMHLLPYMEEEVLYKKIDRKAAWDSKVNVEHFRTEIGAFVSPGVGFAEDERGFPVAHYSSNVHIIGGDQPRALEDIRDGISKTLLAGEAVTNNKAWGHPTNWRDPTLGLRASPDGFGGPWNGQVTIMVFADGRAQAIPSDIDPRVLQAIATPAGGEAFDPEDLE